MIEFDFEPSLLRRILAVKMANYDYSQYEKLCKSIGIRKKYYDYYLITKI